jgi:ubiquinone biosynthesis monooxygenase Coq7
MSSQMTKFVRTNDYQPAGAVALPSREALTVRRILKVNHAGEHGAIRIYGAQIAVARWLYPDIVDELAEMRNHEIEHRRIFREAMPPRGARPCRVMTFWGLGGSVLGLITALMGRKSIWTCTAAVEAAVHRHLDDQLHFLTHRDREVHAAILAIREEELSHLRAAEKHAGSPTFFGGVLHRIVASSTNAVIWLSTWGDSTRMERELQKAGSAE